MELFCPSSILNHIPIDFDYNTYIKLNNDLGNLNEKAAKIHYITKGIIEKRLYKLDLPKDFDYNKYIELNNDLKDLNEIQSKIHYMKIGVLEKRLYKLDLPEDFDYNIYIQLNNDLRDLNEIQAKIHYIKFGVYEKRLYSIKLSNTKNSSNTIIEKQIIVLDEDIFLESKKIKSLTSLELQKIRFRDILNIPENYDNIIGENIIDQRVIKEYIISVNHNNNCSQFDIIESENVNKQMILKNNIPEKNTVNYGNTCMHQDILDLPKINEEKKKQMIPLELENTENTIIIIEDSITDEDYKNIILINN
jgi:gluconate kinase